MKTIPEDWWLEYTFNITRSSGQQFFVATKTSLPRYYLAAKGE
jgi:hypothetical protein